MASIPRELWEKVAARRSALPSEGIRRAIRLSAGLTQAEMAQVLGTTRPTVTRYETGTREPRGEMRQRYAALLEELRGV